MTFSSARRGAVRVAAEPLAHINAFDEVLLLTCEPIADEVLRGIERGFSAQPRRR